MAVLYTPYPKKGQASLKMILERASFGKKLNSSKKGAINLQIADVS